MITKAKLEIDKSGLKQSYIANILDLDETLFSRYLNGHREIPQAILKRLAKILGVKPADLT